MLIKNGRIVLSDRILEGSLEIADGKILRILDEKFPEGNGIDAGGNYISPGFIDIHVHAIEGHDTMDGSYNSINEMSKSLLKYGITSFTPSTMTEGAQKIKKAVNSIAEAMERGTDGAAVIGINLEGPFISRDMAGAQDSKYILKPDYDDFLFLVGNNVNKIKLITIAPEVEGAEELIKKLCSLGITISAGHTNGGYDDFIKGHKWGVTHCTHLFNAMTGFHHRNPGTVGGIFDTDVTAELILDGIHVHYASARTVLKVKGPDRINLISDAMMACGLSDGFYTLGGLEVHVKSGDARLKDGTLAGSTLTLNKAVYNAVSYLNLPIYDAVKMASSVPAREVREDMKIGYIKEGYDADIIIFDEEINIKHAFVKGQQKK